MNKKQFQKTCTAGMKKKTFKYVLSIQLHIQQLYHS